MLPYQHVSIYHNQVKDRLVIGLNAWQVRLIPDTKHQAGATDRQLTKTKPKQRREPFTSGFPTHLVRWYFSS